MPTAYASVSLPKTLAQKVKKLIKGRSLGYRSLGEFVTDATRRRLEEVEVLPELREARELAERAKKILEGQN